MVRRRGDRWRQNEGSPHTRGDGPRGAVDVRERGKFSPHAWGWSEQALLSYTEQSVLPTRVGMVRESIGHTLRLYSSPHTRGDGPL